MDIPTAGQHFSELLYLMRLTFQDCGIRQHFIHHSIVDHTLSTACKPEGAVALISMNHRWCDVTDDGSLGIPSQRWLQYAGQFAVPVGDVAT